MNWYKRSNSFDLPPIPPGYLRGVHISKNYKPDSFFNKFDYHKQGTLVSTARIFTSNDEIASVGLFFKNDVRFNDGYAIIFDIPQEDFNFHDQFGSSPGFIPGNFVFGGYSSETKLWTKNPNYNPNGSSLPEGYKERLEEEKKKHMDKYKKSHSVLIPISSKDKNLEIF